MRKLLGGLCVVVFAVVFYNYYRSEASGRVKAQMLRLVDDMELSAGERAETKRLVETCHVLAFDAALHINRELGRKFDEKSYYDELFTRMVDQARGDGHAELAQKLSQQKDLHSLEVTER